MKYLHYFVTCLNDEIVMIMQSSVQIQQMLEQIGQFEIYQLSTHTMSKGVSRTSIRDCV